MDRRYHADVASGRSHLSPHQSGEYGLQGVIEAAARNRGMGADLPIFILDVTLPCLQITVNKFLGSIPSWGILIIRCSITLVM